MAGFVKFYHSEETFHYFVHRVMCKTVWQDKTNCLLLEIETTEDLDHIPEDAVQNNFPKIILTIDDYPIDVSDVEQLKNTSISIPNSFEERLDKDGEPFEVVYTNIALEDDDLEIIENHLVFKSSEGKSVLSWKGKCPKFNDPEGEYISFEAQVELENI